MSLIRVHSQPACIQTHIFVSSIQKSIPKSESCHDTGKKHFQECNVNVIWIYIHSILLQQHTQLPVWWWWWWWRLLLYNKSNITHNENIQTSPLLPHSYLLAVGPVKVSNPC